MNRVKPNQLGQNQPIGADILPFENLWLCKVLVFNLNMSWLRQRDMLKYFLSEINIMVVDVRCVVPPVIDYGDTVASNARMHFEFIYGIQDRAFLL